MKIKLLEQITNPVTTCKKTVTDIVTKGDFPKQQGVWRANQSGKALQVH